MFHFHTSFHSAAAIRWTLLRKPTDMSRLPQTSVET